MIRLIVPVLSCLFLNAGCSPLNCSYNLHFEKHSYEIRLKIYFTRKNKVRNVMITSVSQVIEENMRFGP